MPKEKESRTIPLIPVTVPGEPVYPWLPLSVPIPEEDDHDEGNEDDDPLPIFIPDDPEKEPDIEPIPS